MTNSYITNLINFDVATISLFISSSLVAITSFYITFSKNLLQSVVLMSVFSLFISICYLLMDAPDVAMTEVALGACLSTLILLSLLKLLKKSIKSIHQKKSIKLYYILTFILCIFFIITLTWVGLDLPLYADALSPINTHVSKYYLENTNLDIGISSVVAGVLASYRGFDTLGETSVILIAGLSVVLILSEKEEKIRDENV